MARTYKHWRAACQLDDARMHTTLTHTQRPLRLQSSGDLHDAPPLFNPAQNALAAMASTQKLSRAHIVQRMSQ